MFSLLSIGYLSNFQLIISIFINILWFLKCFDSWKFSLKFSVSLSFSFQILFLFLRVILRLFLFASLLWATTVLFYLLRLASPEKIPKGSRRNLKMEFLVGWLKNLPVQKLNQCTLLFTWFQTLFLSKHS